MGYQPEYGQRLIRERFAEETLPYYRIITKGTDDTDVALAGVGDKPIGVTLASEEWGRPDGRGGIVKRTGYVAGEMIEAQATGVAYVELGGTVAVGDLCVADSQGRGVTGTLSDSVLATELQAVAGTFLDAGDIGDKVRIDQDRRQ